MKKYLLSCIAFSVLLFTGCADEVMATQFLLESLMKEVIAQLKLQMEQKFLFTVSS